MMTEKQVKKLTVNLTTAKERLEQVKARASSIERETPTAYIEIRQAKNAVLAAQAVVKLYTEQLQTAYNQGVAGK